MKTMQKLILIMVCLGMSSLSIAAQQSDQIQAKLDYALKQCLDQNNVQSGPYKIEQLNDFSYHIENLPFSSVEQHLKMIGFVEENTKAFFAETELMHLETSGDRQGNKIFEKCMQFYHSQHLKKFIKELKE